jgi:hypothetical protein
VAKQKPKVQTTQLVFFVVPKNQPTKKKIKSKKQKQEEQRTTTIEQGAPFPTLPRSH